MIFDEDPFLILAWRGRPRDRLLSELRVWRCHADDTGDDGAIEAADGDTSLAMPGWVALIDGSDVPIDVDPDRFWGDAEAIPRLDRAPVPTSMPDAILHELPASGPAGGDRRPIEESLEPLYAEIVRAASELLAPRRRQSRPRHGADPDPGPDDATLPHRWTHCRSTADSRR